MDQIGGLLDEWGSESYFVEIGGERKSGLKADGNGWVPAIEAPLASQVYEIFRTSPVDSGRGLRRLSQLF